MRAAPIPRTARSIPSRQTPPAGAAEHPAPTPEQQTLLTDFQSALKEIDDDVSRLARCFDMAAEFDDRSHPIFSEMVSALMDAVARVCRMPVERNQWGYLNWWQHEIQAKIECFDPGAGTAHQSMLMEQQILPSVVNKLLDAGPDGICLAFNVLSAAHRSDHLRNTSTLSELTHQVVHAAVEQVVSDRPVLAAARWISSHASAPPELRTLVVHACIANMEEAQLKERPTVDLLVTQTLDILLDVPEPDALDPSVNQHLGQLLAAFARTAMGALSNASNRSPDQWSQVKALFANPLVPVEHKRGVAAQIAQACLGTLPHREAPHFSDEARDSYRLALIACTLHLPDPQRGNIAEAFLADCSSHEFAGLAKLARSLQDAQIAERMRAELHPRMLAVAPQAEFDHDEEEEELVGFVEFFWETMHIDQGANPDLLFCLSQSFTESVVMPEISDKIAVLTFQADPNGHEFVPGSQTRDASGSNPDYLVGGTPYLYPQWLVDRRKILQDATQSWQAPVGKSETANMAASLAAITAQYEGRRVQPSDWPRLLEILKAARANH